MWPLNIILPSGLTVRVMPHHLWLAGALLTAIGLFAAYVNLLNRSVEQGIQWRAAQEATAVHAAQRFMRASVSIDQNQSTP
jgi:hypothetical protein